MAATVIVVLPLIESRVGIVNVLQRIGQGSVEKEMAGHNAYYVNDSSIYQKSILVPVDGSQQSLRALNYAASIYATSHDRTMIYILNVIEWADKDEESMDEELGAVMEEQGRRMLRSIMIPKSAREYERMVKLGNPATKIAEMAEKLKVNMIVMGATGLSNGKEIGHVSSEVLKLTSIPVMFMK
jgi:urea-proton symporter